MSKLNLDSILTKRLDKDFLIQLFQEQTEVHSRAIEVSLTKQEPQSWRASWILSHCTCENDTRIQPFISDLIKILRDRKDGHQREILKILSQMELNEEQEGKLFDICMTLWEDLSKAPAVRYVAFKFVHKTCTKYPDLKGELTFICQNQYLETLSPGIQKSVQKIIKNVKR